MFVQRMIFNDLVVQIRCFGLLSPNDFTHRNSIVSQVCSETSKQITVGTVEKLRRKAHRSDPDACDKSYSHELVNLGQHIGFIQNPMVYPHLFFRFSMYFSHPKMSPDGFFSSPKTLIHRKFRDFFLDSLGPEIP